MNNYDKVKKGADISITSGALNYAGAADTEKKNQSAIRQYQLAVRY
jgi:hypothetical protein